MLMFNKFLVRICQIVSQCTSSFFLCVSDFSLFGHVCGEHKNVNVLAPSLFRFQIVFVCSFRLIAATIAITHQPIYLVRTFSQFIVSIRCKLHFILRFVIDKKDTL